MARNEEKQYGRLNRLMLLKQKEELEKIHPQRPRLDSLHSVEEIQKWLPSIKKDLEFYLQKSQVTCYNEKHIEECRIKIIQLEKEFKAFVRKLKQLTPENLDAIPWTNRAYKRKNSDSIVTEEKKGFVPIASPILDKELPVTKNYLCIPNLPLMDQPLRFNVNFEQAQTLVQSNISSQSLFQTDSSTNNYSQVLNQVLKCEQDTPIYISKSNIVDYDSSSDSDIS